MSFRLARLGDAAVIGRMSRELIESGLVWSWRPERVAEQIRSPESTALVANIGGRLAGFAIMHFGEMRAHLNLLAVGRACQRSGIGRGMLEWLEASARTAGIQSIRLEVRAGNGGARAFYRSLGYREIEVLPGYYWGREAAVRMAHDLVPHRCNPADAEWICAQWIRRWSRSTGRLGR